MSADFRQSGFPIIRPRSGPASPPLGLFRAATAIDAEQRVNTTLAGAHFSPTPPLKADEAHPRRGMRHASQVLGTAGAMSSQRKQLRFVSGRFCDSGKAEVVLRLSMKTMRH
jgi:hypothetical protein